MSHRRLVAEVTFGSLGLSGERLAAALEAAERLSDATGLTVSDADEAVYRIIAEFSPKPQRPSPYAAW